MKPSGFTLIEMVVVIVVVGILAVTVLPRFANKSDFEQAGFRNQVLAVIQYARKTAVASRRYVCVTSAANTLSTVIDTRLPENAASPFCPVGSNVSLPLPGSSAASLAAPSSVTLGAAAMVFDAQGQALNAAGTPAPASLTITGGVAITVEQSGYVH